MAMMKTAAEDRATRYLLLLLLDNAAADDDDDDIRINAEDDDDNNDNLVSSLLQCFTMVRLLLPVVRCRLVSIGNFKRIALCFSVVVFGWGT